MGIFNNKKTDLYQDEPVEYKNVQPTIEPIMPKVETQQNAGALKMKMMRPTELENVIEVADCLKAGQTVVLNLDSVDADTAKRMIDYLAGVLYAINGDIERPADRTFLLTPSGVSVDSIGVQES